MLIWITDTEFAAVMDHSEHILFKVICDLFVSFFADSYNRTILTID
jgi:hypothetical protein